MIGKVQPGRRDQSRPSDDPQVPNKAKKKKKEKKKKNVSASKALPIRPPRETPINPLEHLPSLFAKRQTKRTTKSRKPPELTIFETLFNSLIPCSSLLVP